MKIGWIILILILLAVAVVAVLFLTGVLGGNDDDTATTVTPEPTPEPTPMPSPEIVYQHTLAEVPSEGDNTLGDLTWSFSMAANGDIESGDDGRGARFAVADSDTQLMTISTTIETWELSRVSLEAAMGGGGDTIVSVTLNGVALGHDIEVLNSNGLYNFDADGQAGELVITLRATVRGKQSYIKSITLYTGEFPKAAKVNYHGHTTRCGHASGEDESYVKSALNNGFTIMGFSDHVMLPWVTYENGVRGQYRQASEYYASIRALQKQYEGQIEILLGFEAEWPKGGLFEEYYRYIIDNGFIDYLVLGNHWQNFDTTTNRFVIPDENNLDELAHVTLYVETAIEAMESGLFSVIAHPEIFFVAGYGHVRSFTPEMQALVKQMCEVALAQGVAMELNHGYVNNMESRACYTDFWNIVKDVGNTVVIGVDAHSPGAYNEATRTRVLAFAEKIGLTVSEDLGIRRATQNPDAAVFLLPGQVEFDGETDVAEGKNLLTFNSFKGINGGVNAVAFDMNLPDAVKFCSVTWQSSNRAVLSDSGVVTRAATDTDVTLTATIQSGDAIGTKDFVLTILALGTTPEVDVPDFISRPGAWSSSSVKVSRDGDVVVFATDTAGTAYQNAKLTLDAPVILPRSVWADTYFEYDFTVTGGKLQFTMSYAESIANGTIANLGQPMADRFTGSADYYHGSLTGRLSFQQIADYIATQPDAGWGGIEVINGDTIVLQTLSVWFNTEKVEARVNALRVVYG